MDPNIQQNISPQNPTVPQQQIQEKLRPVSERPVLPFVLIILFLFIISVMVGVIFYKQSKTQTRQIIAIAPTAAAQKYNSSLTQITSIPSISPAALNTQYFESVFDSFDLPSSFKLIYVRPGNDGSSGTASLEHDYAVQGTRESIMKELEPILAKKGYILQDSLNYYKDYGYNEYFADNKSIYLGLDIRLFPVGKNSLPVAKDPEEYDYNPNSQVNKISFDLSE